MIDCLFLFKKLDSEEFFSATEETSFEEMPKKQSFVQAPAPASRTADTEKHPDSFRKSKVASVKSAAILKQVNATKIAVPDYFQNDWLQEQTQTCNSLRPDRPSTSHKHQNNHH